MKNPEAGGNRARMFCGRDRERNPWSFCSERSRQVDWGSGMMDGGMTR